MNVGRRVRRLAFCALPALAAGGCTAFQGLAIHAIVGEAKLPERQIRRDVAYWQGEDFDPVKHRLDFFRPDGAEGWPTLVFVHGGSWTGGDKALAVGSFTVYANIGRFYAARGLGVAVINYRLQPQVTWREQMLDVGRAIAWVQNNVGAMGGDPGRIFLIGHSAGGELISYVALAEGPLRQAGGRHEGLCAVVPVSGAGFDLADEKTYTLGADREFYRQRFQVAGQPDGEWQKEASVTSYLARPARRLPFLIFYSAAEWPDLGHQNELFAAKVAEAGLPVQKLVVEELSHARMALAISDPEAELDDLILALVRDTPCR